MSEQRYQRIARLKNKFRAMGRVKRLKEFVRYDRAKKGQLAHNFPPEYVEDCWQALWEMLRDDFDGDRNFNKFLETARQLPSEPFVKLDGKN